MEKTDTIQGLLQQKMLSSYKQKNKQKAHNNHEKNVKFKGFSDIISL